MQAISKPINMEPASFICHTGYSVSVVTSVDIFFLVNPSSSVVDVKKSNLILHRT